MKQYEKYEVKEHQDFKELMEESAKRYGERPLFRQMAEEGVRSTNCAEFIRLVKRLGGALLELGLLDGGKIAVVGETSVKWIASYFAAVCGGGVIVPVDKELPVDEMAHILNDSKAGAIVYAPTMQGVMEQLEPLTPDLRYLIGMESRQSDGKWLSFDSLIQNVPDEWTQKYEALPQDRDKLCTILYTSGTTGQSKGVMLCQKNIMSVVAGGLALLDIGDTCLSVLPIHHSYEFSHGIVMMIQNGTTICIGRGIRYFADDLNLHRPNAIFLVPAFVEYMDSLVWKNARENGKEEELRALMEKSAEQLANGQDHRKEYFKEIHDKFGGRLELLLCGAAPLPASTMKEFRDWGILLVTGYGITECAPLVAVNGNRYHKDGSVGLPIPCNEVSIRNTDENGEGEIWVKGKNVMLGYYHNPQATQEAVVGDWFDTGDLGHLDEDGYLFITGRKKNLIVLSNGKNVYPEEIEEYYMRVPYVSEVVVYESEQSGKAHLCAEFFVDEAYREAHGTEETLRQLQDDIAKINKTLPVYKQVHLLKLREARFEKTTKRTIKRYTIKK